MIPVLHGLFFKDRNEHALKVPKLYKRKMDVIIFVLF